MTRIASRVSQLHGEGALAVYSRAKELEREGRSIIHLELGEPDFHPAAPIVDAVRNAVAEGRDRYCSTRGVPALREAIADYLKRTRRVDAGDDGAHRTGRRSALPRSGLSDISVVHARARRHGGALQVGREESVPAGYA